MPASPVRTGTLRRPPLRRNGLVNPVLIFPTRPCRRVRPFACPIEFSLQRRLCGGPAAMCRTNGGCRPGRQDLCASKEFLSSAGYSCPRGCLRHPQDAAEPPSRPQPPSRPRATATRRSSQVGASGRDGVISGLRGSARRQYMCVSEPALAHPRLASSGPVLMPAPPATRPPVRRRRPP